MSFYCWQPIPIPATVFPWDVLHLKVSFFLYKMGVSPFSSVLKSWWFLNSLSTLAVYHRVLVSFIIFFDAVYIFFTLCWCVCKCAYLCLCVWMCMWPHGCPWRPEALNAPETGIMVSRELPSVGIRNCALKENVPYSERPAYFSCCWLGNRNSFCHWYNYSVKVMLRNRNAASVPVFPSCLGNCVCEYVRVLCSREITGRPRGLEAECQRKRTWL